MTNSIRPRLFCFGLGYSARTLARLLVGEGWLVTGTCRGEVGHPQRPASGVTTQRFDRAKPLAAPAAALRGVTDILSSVPPDAEGDPVLDHCESSILAADRLRWVGYLSTTGVYGDTGGAVVDETSPLRPTSERSHRRVLAEQRWLRLYREHGVPVHIFRLAGIYGPGRSTLDQIRAGEVRRVHKPNHLFSRIHVDDIANVLRASMARPNPGSIYNVCDDVPAEQSEVVAFACQLLGEPPPPPISFEEAMARMSPMARSFWRDNRRVDNMRMKRELGIRLQYPDYRTGLAAILAEASGDAETETTDKTRLEGQTQPD